MPDRCGLRRVVSFVVALNKGASHAQLVASASLCIAIVFRKVWCLNTVCLLAYVFASWRPCFLVCSLAWLLVRLRARLLVCFLACFLGLSLACLFACLIVCSFACPTALLFLLLLLQIPLRRDTDRSNTKEEVP